MPTLTQRIEANRTTPSPKVSDLRPVPMWRKRIELNRAKELTPFFIDGAWVRPDQNGAA